MKTTSLAKAPIGHILFVIEPNQVGYDKLVNMKVGDITFQALIDGMKDGIKTNKESNDQQDLKLQDVFEEIKKLKEQNEVLRKEVSKLKREEVEL